MTKKWKTVRIANAAPKTWQSKQVDSIFKGIDGVIEPKYDPSALILAYDKSFVLWWVADRIATACASWFIFPDKMSELSKKALQTIDLKYVFLSLFTTGNVFLEKLRAQLGTTVLGFEKFLTDEIRIKINKETKEKKFVQKTWNTTQSVDFSLQDVIHVKETSLSSRYYWDPKCARCIDQIVLLGHVDRFYLKLFYKWFLKTKIMIDKDSKLSEENKTAIVESVNNRLKGADNAFGLMIVPSDISVEDFESDIDTKAFLDYRKDLIQSVAIGLVIPIDIILPEWSARATKEASLEELNRDIITPLQELFLKALQEQVWEDEIPGISELKLYPVDTKNLLDDMKVNTGYKDSGVITANEIRKDLWLEPHPEGNVLEVKKKDTTAQDSNSDTKIMQEIYKTIEQDYESYKS